MEVEHWADEVLETGRRDAAQGRRTVDQVEGWLLIHEDLAPGVDGTGRGRRQETSFQGERRGWCQPLGKLVGGSFRAGVPNSRINT